jgi:hypothetical protein
MQTDLLTTNKMNFHFLFFHPALCKMSQDRVFLCQLRNRLVLTSGNSETKWQKMSCWPDSFRKKKLQKEKD